MKGTVIRMGTALLNSQLPIYYGNAGIIVSLVIAVYAILTILIALIRGPFRSGLRLLTIVISALISLILSFMLKGSIHSVVDGTIVPLLARISPNIQTYYDTLFQEFSSNITVLESILCSLFIPVVFLAIFIALSIVSMIAYIIIAIVSKIVHPKHKFRPFLSMLFGAIQACAVVAVFLLPISCYLDVATAVTSDLKSSGMMDPHSINYIGIDQNDDTIKLLEALDSNGIVKIYRTFGGKATYNALTSLTVETKTSTLSKEAHVITGVVCDVYEIVNTNVFDNYAEEHNGLITGIAQDINSSATLPFISKTVVRSVTEAWNNGEAYMGISKPSVGSQFEDLFDQALHILNEDSVSTEFFSEDLTTVAQLFELLAVDGVLRQLEDGGTSSVQLLGMTSTVNSAIAILESNPRTAKLVPEIHRITLSTVSKYLVNDGAYSEEYDAIVTGVADVLDDTAELPREERTEAVKDKISEVFESSDIQVSDSLMDTAADAVVDYYDKNGGEISTDTEQLVKDFLESYAKGEIDIPDEVLSEIGSIA